MNRCSELENDLGEKNLNSTIINIIGKSDPESKTNLCNRIFFITYYSIHNLHLLV